MCVTGAGWELALPFGRNGLKASWQEVDQGSDIQSGKPQEALEGNSHRHIKLGGSNQYPMEHSRQEEDRTQSEGQKKTCRPQSSQDS